MGHFSFENPAHGEGGFSTSIPDWTVSGSAGNFNPSSSQYSGPVPDGVQVAFVNPNGQLSQVLGEVLAEGVYTLSVGLPERDDRGAPNYLVQLFAGTTLLGEFDETDFPTVDNDFVTGSLTAVISAADPNPGQPLER